MRKILLPNRELMQANFALAVNNSLCPFIMQEWELAGIQNGTVLGSGWPRGPRSRLLNSRAGFYNDASLPRLVAEARIGRRGTGPFQPVESVRRRCHEKNAGLA